MSIAIENRPPLPPFTFDSAVEKVRKAEDAWNTRDPGKVALAYTVDSYWRNRGEFLQGRPAIVLFLREKWALENEYRLIKELWGFAKIEWPCVSFTNRITQRANGFVAMAMNSGSSTNMV
jgi:nuclear transport factor 2 (NTF2) superfamily protein